MSGNRKSLTDFASFTQKRNTEPVQNDVIEKGNTNTEQSYGTVNTPSEPKQESATDILTNDHEQGFLDVFSQKKKPTVEETHTRQTYLIRNDLIAQLDKLAHGKDRGFKTHLVNYALEQIMNELQKK